MIAAADVQDMIYAYGLRAAISKTLLQLPTAPVWDGSHYLEIINGEYHLVNSERGVEFDRKISENIDDILFWFFDSVCSRLAFRYELENRVEGQDCRRIAFAKKKELIRIINNSWEERLASEVRGILRSNPFSDS